MNRIILTTLLLGLSSYLPNGSAFLVEPTQALGASVKISPSSSSSSSSSSTHLAAASSSYNDDIDGDDATESTLRRSLLLVPFISTLSGVCFGSSSPANAFDNAIPEYKKYADKPKRRGSPPKDLGLLSRTTEGEDDTVTKNGLRSCDGNPNCFSTTGDFRLEDRQQYGVDFLIAPWQPSKDDSTPLKTVAAVMKTYEPGQGGIDGGGFTLVKETNSYLYYQFESLKKGFIDDVEFATSPDGILVRSASRVGFTDFGVNAVRLNYIASKLREKGWSIAEINEQTHRDYWNAASEARDATFDPDRRNMDGGGSE